jgi:hypothetical protein
MILHNLFIDLGEPFEKPLPLKGRVAPIVMDDDEDPCVRNAKIQRDRLALFVNEYYKIFFDGSVCRTKEVGQ